MPKNNERKCMLKLDSQAPLEVWGGSSNPKETQVNLICGIIKHQINQRATETLFQQAAESGIKDTSFYLQPRKILNVGIKEFVLSLFCLAISNLPGQRNLSANYCLQVRKVIPCYTNVLLTLGLNVFDNSFPCSKKFKIVDFKSRFELVRQCWNVSINLQYMDL